MGQALPDTSTLDFTLQAARLISLSWQNEGLGLVQASAIGSKTRDRAVCGLGCFSLLVCFFSWEEAGLVVWVGGCLVVWVGR